MFALLLAVALLGLGAQGAPNPLDCGPSCDRTPITKSGSYSRHGSYRSWASQSSYGANSGVQSGSSLGSTGARLEDLGETGLERPDSWQDRKDYVTNDGRGQMHYEAGQTVFPNGYSKYAKHSYSYGSHDNNNARLSNAEVISTAEFSQQFQNIRERIRSFMGNFALGAGSNIDANFLQDFNTKASMYSQQMNDVCNQYDVNSSAYQQMKQLQQQFERQVQERKQAIENVIEQHSSSSSSYTKVESVNHAPVRKQPAAPIVEYVAPREDTVAIQRATDQINQVQGEINAFWSTFSHVESTYEFSQNFKTKVDGITQQLSKLSQNPVPNESIRRQIQNLKSTFNSYCETITNYIKMAEEDKHKKEEERLRQKQLRLDQERKSYEDQITHVQTESLRLQQELELQKSKHQQQEYQMQQQLEQERARQRQLDAEKQRIQTEEFAIEQEEIKIQQQKLESQRQQSQLLQQIQQQQQQLSQIEIEVAQQPQPVVVQPARIVEHKQPEVSETVKVEGHTHYEHHIKGSSTSGSHQGGRYVQQQQQQQVHQPPLESHVDVTAMINKLQQDLYRLQNEVNNFNGYSMRLTSSNSASVVSEANSQASNLRQRLEDLCSNSRKYQNQQILNSAEDLEKNFDRMVEDFKSQAASFSASAGFSSQSAWSSSQKQSRVHAPTISDVEVEHSKTTEVEFKGRPGRRYTAGHQVECVESQIGQPCVDPLQGRRKRHAGEPDSDYQQRNQPIFEDNTQSSGPREENLEDYLQSRVGPGVGILPLEPNSRIEDSLQRARGFSGNQQRNEDQEMERYQRPRSEQNSNLNQESQRVQPITVEETMIDSMGNPQNSGNEGFSENYEESQPQFVNVNNQNDVNGGNQQNRPFENSNRNQGEREFPELVKSKPIVHTGRTSNREKSEDQPLRGDLPGVSLPDEEEEEELEPVTTERQPEINESEPTEPQLVITERIPVTTVPVPMNNRIPYVTVLPSRIQIKNNQTVTFLNQGVNCTQKANSQSNQFNGGFFYNHHTVHHKYNFTRTKYYSNGANLGLQSSNIGTLNPQSSYPQFNQFTKPVEFNQRINTQQASNYKIETRQNYNLNYKPHQFEQQNNDFNIFQQQTRDPFFNQPLRHVREFNQQTVQPENYSQQQQRQVPHDQELNQRLSGFEEYNQQQQRQPSNQESNQQFDYNQQQQRQPSNQESNDQFDYNQQQHRYPLNQGSNQQLNRYDYNQQQQRSGQFNQQPNVYGYEATVKEMNRTDPLGPETETSTPQTFWKRVGNKLSNSYEKAKEKARDIFG